MKNNMSLRLLLADKDKKIEELNNRLNNIKKYIKQIRLENQQGILSSYNLIEENLYRLCDGKDLIESRDEE